MFALIRKQIDLNISMKRIDSSISIAVRVKANNRSVGARSTTGRETNYDKTKHFQSNTPSETIDDKSMLGGSLSGGCC